MLLFCVLNKIGILSAPKRFESMSRPYVKKDDYGPLLDDLSNAGDSVGEEYDNLSEAADSLCDSEFSDEFIESIAAAKQLQEQFFTPETPSPAKQMHDEGFQTPRTRQRYPSPEPAKRTRTPKTVPKRALVISSCLWWLRHILESPVGEILRAALAAEPTPLRVLSGCSGQFSEGWSYLVSRMII